MRSFCMVEAIREYEGHRKVSRRYYLCSLACSEEQIAHSIRSHWQVENSLHWCLDVVFKSKIQ